MKPMLIFLIATTMLTTAPAGSGSGLSECDEALQAAIDVVDASPTKTMDAAIASALEDALEACPDDSKGGLSIQNQEKPFDSAFMVKLPVRLIDDGCRWAHGRTLENVQMQYGIVIHGQMIGPILGVGTGWLSYHSGGVTMSAKDDLMHGFHGQSTGSGGIYLFGVFQEGVGNAAAACKTVGTDICWASGYGAIREGSPTIMIGISGQWEGWNCLAPE